MAADIFPAKAGGLVKLGEDTENESWRRVIYELAPMQMTVWYQPFSAEKCDSVYCDRRHIRRYHLGEERVYRLWMPWTYFFMLASPGPPNSARSLSIRSIMARQRQSTSPSDRFGFLPLPNTSYGGGVTCFGNGRHRTNYLVDDNSMVPVSAIDDLMSLYFGATWNDDDPMDVRDRFWQHFSPAKNRTAETSHAFFAAWEKADRDQVLAAPLTISTSTRAELLKGGTIYACFDSDPLT